MKPWSEKNQIYCLRKGQKLRTSLNKIGQQRFFYKAEKLSSEELIFLEKIINNAIGDRRKDLQNILSLYNKFAESDDYTKKCGIEDIHALIESRSIELLEKLYNNDLSFFLEEKSRTTFSFFISAQYTRTNRMRSNMLNLELSTSNLNMERLSRVFHLIFIEIISHWIFDRCKMQLLINDSPVNFITGDQPVINTKSNPNSLDDPEGFEFYYPISTKKAIIINDQSEGIRHVKENEVNHFNDLIYTNSVEHIYSIDMTSLDKFL